MPKKWIVFVFYHFSPVRARVKEISTSARMIPREFFFFLFLWKPEIWQYSTCHLRHRNKWLRGGYFRDYDKMEKVFVRRFSSFGASLDESDVYADTNTHAHEGEVGIVNFKFKCFSF